MAIPLSLDASLGRVCRKLGSGIKNPGYNDCIRCVAVDTAASLANRKANRVSKHRECVFIRSGVPGNYVGDCRKGDRDERSRATSGSAEIPSQCRDDYIGVITAAAGKAALGFEYEFVGSMLYWGRSKTTLEAPSQADDQVVAHTADAVKIGPNSDIHALSVTVDLGATTEMISGPIPLNHITYVEEFTHAMHIWSATTWDMLRHSKCRKDSDGSFDASGSSGNFRARNLQDVIDKYNENIKGTGAEKFKLQMAVVGGGGVQAELMAKTRKVRVLKCVPENDNYKGAVRKGSPQINFGMKIKALGLGGNEFVQTMGDINAGPKLYTNIQSRLDAWLDAQATLKALKTNLYMRAVFQAVFFVASTESFHSNFKGDQENRGFQSKNVANSMLKGSVQDMIRAIPDDNVRAAILAYSKTNPDKTAISAFFCANGNCDTAHSLLHGITHQNDGYFKSLNKKGTLAATKATYKAAFEGQIDSALKSVFEMNSARYGNVEDGDNAVYAKKLETAKPPKGHDQNWSVKPDACYGLFEIDNEPAMVVEARVSHSNPFLTAFAPDLSTDYVKDTYRAAATNGKAILDTLNA